MTSDSGLVSGLLKNEAPEIAVISGATPSVQGPALTDIKHSEL
jgi:hypothetical protein